MTTDAAAAASRIAGALSSVKEAMTAITIKLTINPRAVRSDRSAPGRRLTIKAEITTSNVIMAC